jgi:hypothetical protein
MIEAVQVNAENNPVKAIEPWLEKNNSSSFE